MRILCVADYHREKELAEGVEKLAAKEKVDVIINAGDFLSEDFARKVLDKTKFRTFVIRGNWDYGLKTNNKNVTILNNQVVKHKGYHFLGVDYGYYSQIPELAKGISPKKLILVTHDPPYDMLDISYFGSNAGLLDLRAAVNEARPVLHVFGHIHEAAGYVKHRGTLFINAALPEFRKAAIVELPGLKVKVFDV
ncbi:MAG: metallophosphoesterase family protein [Candidatus Aenigmatarchaeota archaeon]|nr:MAG: metallophosphoesterase family protein [Candidatus Aenigmarchaeota archaeon]